MVIKESNKVSVVLHNTQNKLLNVGKTKLQYILASLYVLGAQTQQRNCFLWRVERQSMLCQRVLNESRKSWDSRKTSVCFSWATRWVRRGQLKANGVRHPAASSNVICFASLKCSHFNRYEHLRKCVHCKLMLWYAEHWGKSRGSLQLTDVNSLQLHPRWRDLQCYKCSYNVGRCQSQLDQLYSVRPNQGLIDAALLLGKVACPCSSINGLFAKRPFLQNDIYLLNVEDGTYIQIIPPPPKT